MPRQYLRGFVEVPDNFGQHGRRRRGRFPVPRPHGRQGRTAAGVYRAACARVEEFGCLGGE